MFYDIYKKICEENGEKPFSLPLKLGAKSNSVVAQWQKGSIPRADMLQKIADYFGVPVGYLFSDDLTEDPRAYPDASQESKLSEQIPGYDELSEENKTKAREYIALLLNSQHSE